MVYRTSYKHPLNLNFSHSNLKLDCQILDHIAWLNECVCGLLYFLCVKRYICDLWLKINSSALSLCARACVCWCNMYTCKFWKINWKVYYFGLTISMVHTFSLFLLSLYTFTNYVYKYIFTKVLKLFNMTSTEVFKCISLLIRS